MRLYLVSAAWQVLRAASSGDVLLQGDFVDGVPLGAGACNAVCQAAYKNPDNSFQSVALKYIQVRKPLHGSSADAPCIFLKLEC